MSFKGIKAGDKVKFGAYAGMGCNGPEYKQCIAKVNPLLIFDDHVVVNYGNCGTVVNYSNFHGVVRS